MSMSGHFSLVFKMSGFFLYPEKTENAAQLKRMLSGCEFKKKMHELAEQ